MVARDRVVELLQLMNELNDDELRVLTSVARRIARKGRQSYGPLRISSDPRDYVQEAYEEVIDASVYLAAQLERLQDERDAAQSNAGPPTPPRDTIPDPPHVSQAPLAVVPWWDPSNRFPGCL